MGLVLLLAVRCMPLSCVIRHCEESVSLLVEEGNYPFSPYARLDNYTDALILNVMSYEGEDSCLDAALLNSYAGWNGTGSVPAFVNRFSTGSASDVFAKQYYPRYWFGAVAVIRPLLSIMNYRMWRSFNAVCVFMTIGLVLYAMWKKGLTRYVWTFLLSLAMVNPVAIGQSIQYSGYYYLAMTGSLVVLCGGRDRHGEGCLPLVFSLIGALTAYFDLLTFPAATFALPALFYILLRGRKESQGRLVISIAVLLFFWVFGYFSMWFMKWLLASILTEHNVFEEAFAKIVERAGSGYEGERISRIHAVVRNCYAFLQKSPLLSGAFSVLCVCALWRGGVKGVLAHASCFFVSLIPVMWMFLTANHVYIHAFFTNKALLATFFGVLCWVVDSIMGERGRLT